MDTETLNKNLIERLQRNEYPGRVIVIGMNDKGALVIVYAIMGRTENSKNRLFELYGAGNIRTVPIDASKVKDPELIIYNALIDIKKNEDESFFIVTNGRQTDALADSIKSETFSDILKKWKHEPDAPNYTSRISGLITAGKEMKPTFSLSIIKADPVDPENNSRHSFFEILPVVPGIGFCISTYNSNGNPLPAFEGEPFAVPLVGDIDKIAQTYWDTLNSLNKVALVVKVINPTLLTTMVKIINNSKE